MSIGNILAYGFVIFLGAVLLAVKLPAKTNLRLLGHALWVDIGVTVITIVLHFGTFSGLLAAAAAGVMCSITTSSARWIFGYWQPTTSTHPKGQNRKIIPGHYVPGNLWNLSHLYKE